MLTAQKQDLITYKAHLKTQEMFRRWMIEYQGSRLGDNQNGLQGEEGRYLDNDSQAVEPQLQAANIGEPINQVPNGGRGPQNAPNIDPSQLV